VIVRGMITMLKQASSLYTFPLSGFVKYANNPILGPRGDTWEAKDVYNPTAVVKDDLVYLLYRAEDHTGKGRWNGTSRIGLAVSRDGIHFDRYPDPVLYPTEPYEWPGGCEDPRIVQIDGTYYLTYTAFDGHNAYLCLATSDNLFEWMKHGPLFPDWYNEWGKIWTKSGAIVPQKIGGRYVMYFGDTSVWVAYSDDLIHWTPNPKPVFSPVADSFDSVLVEPGPHPIVTDEGILLFYNAAGHDIISGKMRYAVGQILFDKNDPECVIARTSIPLMTPDTDDERFGQVDEVVFVEGFVTHQGRDLLYYGMADSRIGVAIREHGVR
jgi:predicted GH43/DUF377 family glycosyl hydrolase